MTHFNSHFPRQSVFDKFLFASIGDERNGTPLSVLSFLARQDLDPWLEAEKLAALPEESATRALASMFAALRDWPTAGPDTRTIAARLVTLLPHRAGLKVTPQEKALRDWAVTKSVSFPYLIVALTLAALFVISSRAVSTHSDKALSHASSSELPPVPPPMVRQ